MYHYQHKQFNRNFGKSKLDRPRKIQKRETQDSESLLKIFNEHRTADEQLPYVIEYIAAGSSFYRHSDIIRNNLVEIMHLIHSRQTEVFVFGSAFTKLALKSSDVDLFIDFKEEIQNPDTLKWLKNKLQRHKSYFKTLIPIFGKIPLLKCVHSSGINCDITITDTNGVISSKIIKFLLSIDKRIQPLILLVKYLLKKEIVHTNLFSNYAVVILVVFFLQQIDKPILPTMKKLQESATEKQISGCWDFSITKDISKIPKTTNTQTVTELLKNFFEFYAKFEFGFRVISLYTGKSYLKPRFNNVLQSSDFHCYQKHLKENPNNSFPLEKIMCVQNPFIHSSNTTGNVTWKTYEQFREFCKRNMIICQEEFNEEKQNSELFKKLLYPSLPSSKKKFQLGFDLYVGTRVVLKDSNSQTENELRNYWFETVLKEIIEYLTRVLKCTVNVQSDESYLQKANYSNKNGTTNRLLECETKCQCYGVKIRKMAKQELQLDQNLPKIDIEERVSNYLYERAPESAKISIKFEILCTLEKAPTSLFMVVESKDGHDNICLIGTIFTFMAKNFPKWLNL